MNIAILHYHLNRGGVTQVVMNHLRSLESVCASGEETRIALIYGGRRAGLPEDLLGQFSSLDVSLATVDGLEYDEGEEPDPHRLAGDLRRTLDELGFSSDSTVLHVHNHSLGKNLSLPETLLSLTQDGYRMLLHIHDFAEDFRPENYGRMMRSLIPRAAVDLPSLLYPQAKQIHYAALNRRDLNVLQQSGLDKQRLHFLPNPVAEFGELPAKDDARRTLFEKFDVPLDDCYILYPVRGIRRKNLGEAVLWSVIAGPRTTVGFTLAPLNPLERRSYDQWKRFAHSIGLPCVFETGAEMGMPFLENLAAADLILTTSVAEGFGLVFLESWLAGKRLVGRDLPEITADFVANGVCLDGLRSRVSIPIDWLGVDKIFRVLREAFFTAREAYSLPPVSDEQFSREFRDLVADEAIDFACLNSDMQRKVIRMARDSEQQRDELRVLNP
ncbi:MAG: hypothetical protein IH991_15665, partial [Planctomycetes bacterium]|nr:hypothetical protein [Planctomycetota bacterium]